MSANKDLWASQFPPTYNSTGKIVSVAGQNVVAWDSTCDTESLDQVLPFQYGFVITDINLNDPPTKCITLPWDKVHTILGDMEFPLDEWYKIPIAIFLGCFLNVSLS
jgi:hypothetical protein